MRKQKKSSDKMLPPVRIESGTSDSKSNTLVSSERRVLDLKSEVMGSILTGGKILLLEFLLSCSKASDANIANFV